MDRSYGKNDGNNCNINIDDNLNEPAKTFSYASMVRADDISKELDFIPTNFTEDKIEVVVFDEETAKLESERWYLTICGQFVGYDMHINKLGDEIGLNDVMKKGPWMVKNKHLFVQKWSSEIGMQKVEPKKMLVWVKINNVPLEAWSVKGISALATGLGKPILMDTMTAKCVTKELYTDKSNNIKGSKKVHVKYDCVPPVCTHCKVFGHDKKKCLNGGLLTAQRINLLIILETMSGNVQSLNKKGMQSLWNRTKEEFPNSKTKQWSMEDGTSANKYSILDSLPEDNEAELKMLKERMIMDNFFVAKIQTTVKESITWSKDMIEYFKVKWAEIKENEGNDTNDGSDMEDVIEINKGSNSILKENEINGDLNVTLQPNEHSYGSSVMTSDMLEIQECLNNIEVKDICSSGLHYTWTKNLQKTKACNMTGILKKLGRVMSNGEFMKKFPNDHAKFLPYLISDHTPSILCNIHKRVEPLRAQLQKVHTDIDNDPFGPVLRDIVANLVKEFFEAESDEEKFLFQQAKIKWLRDEDKNNSYFHKVIKGWNNRSKVLA
nr:hypothetical protein [Tanacetum cinerariifolium]